MQVLLILQALFSCTRSHNFYISLKNDNLPNSLDLSKQQLGPRFWCLSKFKQTNRLSVIESNFKAIYLVSQITKMTIKHINVKQPYYGKRKLRSRFQSLNISWNQIYFLSHFYGYTGFWSTILCTSCHGLLFDSCLLICINCFGF